MSMMYDRTIQIVAGNATEQPPPDLMLAQTSHCLPRPRVAVQRLMPVASWHNLGVNMASAGQLTFVSGTHMRLCVASIIALMVPDWHESDQHPSTGVLAARSPVEKLF